MRDQPPEYHDIDDNPHGLVQEWIRQPRLYHEAADYAAKCRKTYSEAKASLEVIEAELALDARIRPEHYGLEKATDKGVEAAVAGHPKKKQAAQKMIDAKYDLDIAEGNLSALDHRKHALGDIVTLVVKDFYAKPAAPDGAMQKINDLVEKNTTQRANKSIGGGRKEKTR